MPRREKADETLILEAYGRLQNGMEVARELGLSESTVYKYLRLADRKCARCGGRPEPRQAYCPTCREHVRTKMAEKRKESLRAGKCQECGEPVVSPSRTFCAPHRIAAIERRKRYEDRQKRGAPNQGIPDAAQRRRSNLKKYGEHGVAAYREADGRCEVCQRNSEDVAIHVHHVDENPKNNARANLAVLCFDCHQATHRLLALKARERFLTWFSERYSRPIPS